MALDLKSRNTKYILINFAAPPAICSGNLFPFSVNESTLTRSENRLIRPIDGHGIHPEVERNMWLSILTHYTTSGLTYRDKDKPVALSAITQIASNLLKDDYEAGFFRSDMLWDLTWWITDKDIESERSMKSKGECRAPLWSWASIDGPVMFL